MRLHERLCELHTEASVTQKRAAKMLGCAEATYCQWLSGKDLCKPLNLAKFAVHLVAGSERTKKAELTRLLLLLHKENLIRGAERAAKKDAPSFSDARQFLEETLDGALAHLVEPETREIRTSGRTLCDFPDSFYPMAVISGDKREVSESRINVGDFGCVAASPAEARWLPKLGLRSDVEFFGDKLFVLEDADRLRERFADKNLLVVGSPAGNHLARRLLLHEAPLGWQRGVPVFRFNFEQRYICQIEELLGSLSGFNAKELVGKAGQPETERQVKFWLHQLFGGGIVDPAYRGLWKRAGALYQRDFALISLARNPFSDPKNPRVCILASGFHMFGTAHAIRMLSEPEQFAAHPLGGAIRVDYNPGDDFAVRFDNSTAEWDTDSEYTIDDVKNGLKALREEIPQARDTPPGIHITRQEIDECLEFIDQL